MRKVLLLLLMTVSLPIVAQFEDTETIKTLLWKVPDNNPSEFWLTLYNRHPQNIALSNAIRKGKKSLAEALRVLPNLSGYRDIVSQNAIYDEKARELVERINDITKIESTFSGVKFYVIPDNTPQATMAMDGTCSIYSYWLNTNTSIEELVAICCHEMAHFVLSHQIRDTWKKVKAAKRNAIWAEIGTGIAMGAYAGSQMYAAQNGVAHSYQAQQQMYNNIARAGINAYNEGQWIAENRQKWLYMRESETEADEVAFWFMEKNGMDPIHLINVFKKLEPYEPILSKEQRKISDHPEMRKRIMHIEKMYKKYHKK